MRITFIGGGNMATALIAGLLRQGHSARQISVVEHNAEARARLAADYQVNTYAELGPEAVIADAVVLAVKPQQLKAVAQALTPLLATQLVVSIAAGVRARTLSAWLMGYSNVVRTMPNTPAMIGAGVTALYALPAVQSPQRQMAEDILKSAGSVLWVEDEALMDAVTAVSGSGPAYVFYFIEAMQQAALELGLSSAAARQLALETMLGPRRRPRQSPSTIWRPSPTARQSLSRSRRRTARPKRRPWSRARSRSPDRGRHRQHR